METTKICNKCNQSLSLSNFYIHNKEHNTYRTICKKCCYVQNKANKESRAEKIQEAKEYNKEYFEKHQEKIKAQRSAWYYKNKESIAKKAKEKYQLIKADRQLYLREYYQKNKEKLIKNAKVNSDNNKENVREYKRKYCKTEKGILSSKVSKANRRATEKLAGTLSKREVKIIIDNATKCYWCDTKINTKNRSKFHLDHYEPLAKGGDNHANNIVVSCPECNMSKKAKDPIVFANSVGKLL